MKETCDKSLVMEQDQDTWNDSEAVQCVTACYTVIQCGAVWCSAVQYVTVCHKLQQRARQKKRLRGGAVCCSVSQCVTVCCSVLQCVAVCCSVLQSVAV